MASVFPLANYDTEAIVLSSGAKTDIVTVPTGAGLWFDCTSIRVSKGTGLAGTAVLAWYDASESVEYILNDAGVYAAGIPYDEECMPLHMESGDIIRVTALANNHVVVSFIRGSRNPENRG